jgi:hypothetical protein
MIPSAQSKNDAPSFTFLGWLGFRRAAHITRTVETLRRNAVQGLHLGCGGTRIEGLINCDLYHPDADAQVDALDLSRFAEGER